MDGTDSFNQEGFEERRLERAFKHVNDYWFPPNPELLARIRLGLQKGQYDVDVQPLVQDLRTDFSLFTYCLKELLRMVREEKLSPPQYSNPIELIEWAGPARLKKILTVEDRIISKHSFDSVEAPQALRLQEAMLSASVSEVLASKREVDPRLGFSIALLRQLGLTLIAWNYPTIYPKVMQHLQQGVSVDQALSEELGFSPMLLGLTLVREWGLAPQLRTTLGDSSALEQIDADSREAIESAAQTLTKICEVGETLARANDPEHYPSAQSDWQSAKTIIEDELGKDGMRILQRQARENCENYLLVMPDLFKAALKVDPPKQMQVQTEKQLLRHNPFVDQCAPQVSLKVKDLYVRINSGPITKENIHTLIRRIVPIAGFTAGSIYTLDPGTLTLVRRVKISEMKLRSFASIDFVRDPLNSDAVLSAFGCLLPSSDLTYYSDEENFSYLSGVTGSSLKQQVQYFAGSMGINQKVGVIYLEVDREVFTDSKFDLLTHFKAIRQTLNDCLNLV